MSEIVAGKLFDGVSVETAPGTGFIVGYQPLNGNPLLNVHTEEMPSPLYCVKYYHHTVPDNRGKDRPADQMYALTMLVSEGRWQQRVWSVESGESVTIILSHPGDLIAWGPGLNHSWEPLEDSTMLTVKWIRKLPSDKVATTQTCSDHQKK